ncbi:MAG TPA: Ig-like domain-containing protein, partial [Thermoanaerobaculia bacterium]
MHARLHKTRIGFFVAALLLAAQWPLHAGEVAQADLQILGVGLEVDRQPVVTAVDVPTTVQTKFGGAMNDAAPVAPGLSALGELTGPGIDAPITLVATPGHKFAIPALHEKGEYQLQNIRLAGAHGEFLQQAVPSFAIIQVADALQTSVRVRQLTPEELRARGIIVDSRNYDVYEYTVIFGVDQHSVEIPYPVIIDKRTHTAAPVVRESPYNLPPLSVAKPPRFQPPGIEEFSLAADGGMPDNDGGHDPGEKPAPSIPAAIVLPNGFGVLHQFFAVILHVSNAAPEGSNIRLDSVTASMSAPQQMRVAKVMPAVTIGQPVPVRTADGQTFLVAGAQGSAEWTLEALKAGTHDIDITVNATYQQPGQEDFPLRGKARTAIVVSDPRFQINFSHPDTVRADESYTAYAFVTNLSPQRQHVALDMSEIPACSSGAAVSNICRVEGDGKVELDLEPGEMTPVPYKLTSTITGNVFAGAAAPNDEALGVSVKLTMGVSESGIPLSPATLVMPYYTRFLPSDFIAANMQLLGLAYSLATAPLNQYTAKFPRVIKNDVFQRAQEIARAGQRIVAIRKSRETNDPEENREPFFHLALDLLGNIERVDQAAVAPELVEWDELRRSEKSGRRAATAMAQQLALQGFNNGRSPQQFADDFAAATSHRTPFLFAYVHGAEVAGQTRPYALSIKGLGAGGELDVPSNAATGWVRTLPYAELMTLDGGGDRGELAMIGRFAQSVRVTVVPRAASFTLHLIYPDTADGKQLRSDLAVSGATPGTPVTIDVARGARTLVVSGASVSASVREVPQTALRVLGAAQDLHLDPNAHLVTVLFNRPVTFGDAATLRDHVALTVNVPKAAYSVTRKNTAGGPLQIPGAALQEDGKLLNLAFDKALSQNANYVIAVDSLRDLVGAATFSDEHIVPRIDNDRPGAILTGRVLNGDNSVVPNALVKLEASGGDQFDLGGSDGRFLYEFVPRDVDNGINGTYRLSTVVNGRATDAEGVVRLPGEVHTVNLVFLGRGTARGQVRYSDGEVLANVHVTVGSTLFHQFRGADTDSSGHYEVGDLPVGPLTFSVVDKEGRPTFAANAIRVAGEVIAQDLVIERRAFPGLGKVRVTVRRSDSSATVAGAHVGAYTQGYGLQDGYTDANGFFEFDDVPAGLISIIAADFSISRESVGIEMDLGADQTIEQTIVIPIVSNPGIAYATVEGIVTRDDPAAPADTSKDATVGGAIITIGNLPPVNANADGTYTYPEVPTSLSGRTMWVFDPATGRKGQFPLPSLQAGVNHFSVRLSSKEPEGVATMRVRLTDATGAPVSDYQVFEPGFPPVRFNAKGNGVYELPNVRVPAYVDVVAIPSNPQGPHGRQSAAGRVRVDFTGQIGVLDLRLPGQGKIITKIELRLPDDACTAANPPPCYGSAFGTCSVSYAVWDDAEQQFRIDTFEVAANEATQLVTFDKVPAQQPVTIQTVRHPAGFAAESRILGYEGDVRNVTLRLESLGDVTGRVFFHDRQTPVSGAVVRLVNDRVVFGAQATKPDGSFRFPAVQKGLSFRIVADYSENGIYRTGYVDGTTPGGGGPVSNLVVVLAEQSSIEGQVVDLDGKAVALATYWARELSWPYREFGNPRDPLHADINGRFILTNVFRGPFRITAVAPDNQEVRGDYQGEIRLEGDTSQHDVKVRIGGAGTGTISVSVVDALNAMKPVANAEVTLYFNGGRFDFATTDDAGIHIFENVPVGNYSIRAYSKGAGRAGAIGNFSVGRDQTVSRQVQLDILGKVWGTVTDPESLPKDQPVKGIPVQIDAGDVHTRDSTDGDGKFSIFGVPEGGFSIFAYDLDSGRMAFGPDNLFISDVVQEQPDVHLELEKTGVLTVKAYLPNDNGGAGDLAPLVDVLVEARDYYREAQGNSLAFAKMITRYSYKITVRELGGEQRVVVRNGTFAPGTFEKTESIVFPSSGSVIVTVLDGANKPVQDARVVVADKTLFTPASGVISLTGVPFGFVSAQATKGNVGASASGNLQSRSQPLQLTLNLGSSVNVAGTVEAEQGIGVPSAGTRVVMTFTSRLVLGTTRLETLTDANGAYTFSGVPVGGTALTILFYGPDDTTIGATRSYAIPDGSTGTFTIERVKVDATPARVIAIVPEANSTNVSPQANIAVTFSEPIAASFINKNYFQLLATDDGAMANFELRPSVRPDGTYQVRFALLSQLKSNVLYRIVVAGGIQDTTGNAMAATVGSSFTTVNYTEPAVTRIDPPESEPIPSNVTFRIKFNKPVDIASLQNGGAITLERLDLPNGSAVGNVPLSTYADAVDPSVIVAAPTQAIVEAAFYRLTVSGIRDTQDPPNTQKAPKVTDFFSYDTRRPVATIVSPVAAGEKLVSDILYSARVTVTDEGTNAPSTDVASVDWFDANGVHLRRVTTPPYAYDFTAPPTTTGTTFTLKASANDLSKNASPSLATFTWEVAPNLAPANVTVVNAPASAYPTHGVETTVTFTDEGLKVTAAIKLAAKHRNGSDFELDLGSTSVTRSSTAQPFPAAVFHWTLPLDLQPGSARVVATVTDVGKSGSGEAALDVLDDTVEPEVLSLTPKAESRFAFDSTYTIELQVRDVQTGIASAALSIAGSDVAANLIQHTFDASTGVHTYRYTAKVPARNADTRIAIAARATDNRGNVAAQTVEVIYERVDDATIPQAAWITPLDGAALPFGIANWQATLRVRATDDKQVTSVRFESSALAAPLTVTSPKSGTSDLWEAKASFTMPQDGKPFVVTAFVNDADPSHTVELPITIDPVAVDVPPIEQTTSLSSITAPQYEHQTLIVRGPVRVYVTVPLAVKNVILLDGAALGNLEETKLDLTIAEHLFVDADSRIDVNGKGYLGGLRTREGNSLTNNSRNGRTVGGTADGGAGISADGSHAGIGGEDSTGDFATTGKTNATYGSITDPIDFGSGGAADPNSARAGGNGGGAVLLRGATARFVVAGAIRANGDDAASGGTWTGGAGGSINVRAKALIAGPWTRITANGGDEGGTTADAHGGGGGRIALTVSDRLDVDTAAPLLQARGGRNGLNAADGANYVDGGAGTIFVQRPGSTAGELIVSSFDERYPASTHRSGGTPLAGALTFDRITVGPRALARFDNAYSGTLAADPTALVVTAADAPTATITSTNPPANGQLAQNTSIAATFTAHSTAGIARAVTLLSVSSSQPLQRFDARPETLPETQSNITVPATAPAGAATLRIRVIDRAGRVADSAPVAFSIVDNAAPVIDAFDVTPSDALYAGGTITVTALAHDDIEMKSLTLTSSVGTVTAQPATRPSPQSMQRSFTVFIPNTTPSGTAISLTLSASDDFPNRVPASIHKSVNVQKDDVPPSVTIAKPSADQEILEAANATFPVEVVVTDAQSGVANVKAVFEGVTYTLAPVSGKANTWGASLPVPAVEGVDPVEKTLTITADDFEPNTTPASRRIYIRPLIDANAPRMSWLCASPNALYPAGYNVTLRVYAEGVSAANAVQKVTFAIDGAAPVQVSETSSGSHTYDYNWTVPPDAAAGRVFNIRVAATSTSGAEQTLLGAITVVKGTEIPTLSEISATDRSWENSTVIVKSGGVLDVTGAHAFKDLVVLNGGRVVQRHADPNKPDLITAERLFVACGGIVDANALGYTRNTSYPGAATPLDSSGGGHIGRGAFWAPPGGGTFGSIYRPLERGGAGQSSDGNFFTSGGGVVRMHASSSMTIDGTVRANGSDPVTWGPGAGGSVWLTTPGLLTGGGTIQARGGGDDNNRGGAGGGAVAVEYGSIGGALAGSDGFVVRGTWNGRPGAAGSIYLRGPRSVYGDLVIDNRNAPSGAATELPWLGKYTIGSVDGATATLASRSYLQEFHTGHWARVTAPDGTVRGTWRIGAIVNAPTSVAIPALTVQLSDGVSYDGYLVYSEPGYGSPLKKLVGAKYENGQWLYDNDDNTFVPFVPKAGDRVFASFRKQNAIYAIDRLKCAAACGSVNGIPIAEVASGFIYGNTFGGIYGSTEVRNFGTEFSEILFAFDAEMRGITLVDTPPRVTLLGDANDPVVMQPGDTLRGVYRFDHVTIKGRATVVSRDPLESSTAPVVEAGASLTRNVGAPAVDAAKISIVKGTTGPLLVGSAGAVSDADGKVDVFGRNASKPAPPALAQMTAASYFTTDVYNGALRLFRISNGSQSGSIATQPAGDYGYVSFRDATVGNLGFVGIDSHYFHFPAGGRWEVWVNGAWGNSGFRQGNLDANTRFRLEKTPDTVRWYVDDALVYEYKTAVAPSTPFVFIFREDWSAYDDVEFHSSNEGVSGNAAAADGSFSVPLYGAAGDRVSVYARDRYLFAETSGELAVGAIPSDFGVASLTFPNPVTGGRTVTGTVALRGPAGPNGALVFLTTASSDLTIPPSVTIAPGATSGTFSVTTKPVTTPVSATVNASWGGVAVAGTIEVVKDVDPPVVTITAPAANAQVNEGSANKINIQATVVDSDSGVDRVYATFNNVTVELARNGTTNVYTAQVAAPFVDGAQNVTLELKVYGVDKLGNEGSSAVPVIVVPSTDPNPPSASFACEPDAYVAAGATAAIRITAKAPNAANPLQSVELRIAGQPSVAATNTGGDTWEARWNVPAGEASYDITAYAVTASGTFAAASGRASAVTIDKVFSADATISDAQWDGKGIAVTGGTLIVGGAHSFRHVLVLGGNLTHPNGTPLALTVSGAVYVACGATIDASGRGYAPNGSYPGIPRSANSAGSHIGRGDNEPDGGATYGSIDRPTELGAAGWNSSSPGALAGGGALRIDAHEVVVSGGIYTNGLGGYYLRGGAGGSVWITSATSIRGSGVIEARGGTSNFEDGGGGAIALEYAASLSPSLAIGLTTYENGSTGSLYTRNTAAGGLGDLRLDGRGIVTLPPLGNGIAQPGSGGATLVTTRSDLRAYFAGRWVEITAPDGTLRGTWRIAGISGSTISLDAAADVRPGDAWQGVYRFDNVTAGSGVVVESADPIRIATSATLSDSTLRTPIDAPSVVIAAGTVAAARLGGADVQLRAGARLTHESGSSLTVSGGNFTLAGALDVSTRGYSPNATYPGAAFTPGRGGSHIGRGGGEADAAATYGSVYQPAERGASGWDSSSPGAFAGGGVVRIMVNKL